MATCVSHGYPVRDGHVSASFNLERLGGQVYDWFLCFGGVPLLTVGPSVYVIPANMATTRRAVMQCNLQFMNFGAL